MRILIVTQYFYPENFKSNDLAFELTKRGHEVTVLTGLPNYPEGKVYKDFGFFKKTRENYNGVDVIRTWLIPRGKGGGIRLFLNYFSWAFFASIRAIFLSFQKDFDAVIVHEPSPITQGFPAIIVKKIQKIPLYFWVLDLWPESLTSAGGIKNKIVLNFFTAIVKYIYNCSDKILISSKGFRKSILAKGNYESKLVYFPNWAEDIISKGDVNFPIPELPDGFKILFAGNIGASQDMESIMKSALALKNNVDIKFIIVGDGRSKTFLENFIRQNELEKTVYLMGRFPVEAMNAFFVKADALLVTLKDELIFNLTVPAKVQAYMSSSKPILGMMNGEGGLLIKESGCGYCVPAGNHLELKNTILDLYNLNQSERETMGISGYEYYERNFQLEKCMNNLESILLNK